MDDFMKIYWKLYFQEFSNEEIIKQTHNPIREYENELIDGAIIDIGCGQSPFLLEFSEYDREIFAVDNEQFQLDLLRQRVLKQKNAKIEKWNFTLLNFPQEEIPKKNYSLIILSNFLHFFPLQECIEIGNKIFSYTKKGSLVYVGVHSYKHHNNNPSNNGYFKHFFKIEDLEIVFNSENYERLYYADIDKENSIDEWKLTDRWYEEIFQLKDIKDPEQIKIHREEYRKDKRQSDIVAIFRRL